MKTLIATTAIILATLSPAGAENWVLAEAEGDEEIWIDNDSFTASGNYIEVEAAVVDKSIDTDIYFSMTMNCVHETLTMHPHTMNLEGEWITLTGDVLMAVYQHINQNMMQADPAETRRHVRTVCDAIN